MEMDPQGAVGCRCWPVCPSSMTATLPPLSKEDLDVVLERIDAGEAAQTIAGNDESYAQYLEQYQQRIDSFKAIIGS